MVSQVQVMAALNHYSNFIAVQTEIHHMVVNHSKKVGIVVIHNIYFFYRNHATKIFLTRKSKLSAF